MLFIVLLIVSRTIATSVNQPKFCPSATWKTAGTTVADSNFVSSNSYGLFVNRNNSVYLASYRQNSLYIWTDGNTTPKTINLNLTANGNPYSVFVNNTEDIYVGIESYVYTWASSSINNVSKLYTGNTCYDIFISSKNSLYCSLSSINRVIKRTLNSTDMGYTVAAGTGCAGALNDTFFGPRGIFVDINLNLYVADYGNHRIQVFPPGKLNGTTVVGREAAGTIALLYPTDVILDADGHLFIVDSNNYRIIGSDSNGFRCILGCSGSGTSDNQFQSPQTMAFDSYGNIFVIDLTNNRLQKFFLSVNSCNATNISQSTSMVPTNSQVSSPSVLPTRGQQNISYNRPKLSPLATWSSNATTIANSNLVGSNPYGLYVDSNDTVYVTSYTENRIIIWSQGDSNSSKSITTNTLYSVSIFVTSFGEIFVDNGYTYGRIDIYSLNMTNSTSTMFIPTRCFGIFVDINNTIYCSLYSHHQIVAKFVNDTIDTKRIVAGTGCAGNDTYMLFGPIGIFVDSNFNLYVADYFNNRVQLFRSGQLNGTTIAGGGVSTPITLYGPTSVVLDADDHLFIVDHRNHRIVGSGPNGFRCVAGCSGTNGTSASELNYPWAMGFDSQGNIYVTDSSNGRIQKFALADNSSNITVTTDTPTPMMTSALSTNQSCFTPVITLISSTSSLLAPLEYQRNQDFSISSYLNLNCNSSLTVKSNWTIANCTSTCSYPIRLDQIVIATPSELYIPSNTLNYGIYQLTLTVSMVAAPQLSSSASVYVKIIPSDITVNLIAFGTSMITSGYKQDLLLDPGTHSIDPDVELFNASNWNYEYYCRIYPGYNFPNINGQKIPIDSATIDPQNPSCFSNRTAWRFGNSGTSQKSSVTILANSLQSNETYQFMVQLTNRQNSGIQATGYLLVQVVDKQPQLIILSCVIAALCAPNMQYQFVNPTTQVALFSFCAGTCPPINNITWIIYSGVRNSSSNIVQWSPFNDMNKHQNIWFFGSNTSNFTSSNDLFLSNSSIEYWRFQVTYSFTSETSFSAINFIINKPPQNGSCSIYPFNGTTSTAFTISCSNWTDQDGIKDYSFYSWTTNPAERTMLAFSSVPTIQVRLPAGNDQTTLLHIVAVIRDRLDCIAERNLSSVAVLSDSEGLANLVATFQNEKNKKINNPILQTLSSGNQNLIGQIITSVSLEFNKINNQTIESAISSGIPASNIVVSSLDSRPRRTNTSSVINASALIEYNKQLNAYANVRENLIAYTANLLISTSNSIKLQASALVQITQATNQLTRTTITLASEKCYQLALALYSMAKKIPYEDVKTAATQIAQCANNALNAINGPLQERSTVLDSDSTRANKFPEDYDTDLESEWANFNRFADGSIEKSRNLNQQKLVANQISSQTVKTLSLLTSALNIHLNLGQSTQMNTPSVFMSVETTTTQSLANKSIEQGGNAKIQMPINCETDLTNHSSITIRSMVQPLAAYGNSKSQSNTNLSRSISLSLFDHLGNEIPIRTSRSQPIELIIPRDPNVVIPSMTLQNVTTSHQQLFNLHFVNIANSLPRSVHFEMHPLNTNLSYLFIYKFDSAPILNGSMNDTDGWTIFYPSNLTDDDLYTYFIDNEKAANHQSVIFGLRELNSSVIDQPSNFTSNYELRIYTSGCYYLDSNNNWQSDGLIVGPRTNHYETQCFSTHLTTFASGFIVLPAPINWNYVFANADFNRNKTIYITLIIVCILYVLLAIFARYKDKKDLEKLGVTPLPDNHRSDKYFYEILVLTGHRKDAGTNSKVHFILAGDDGETQVRTLADPKRKILQRGGIDAFIMTMPKSLGLLNYIHIWHDNTGSGASASWFLKYIIVRDLQTMEKFYFIGQKWFAVEKDDGLIERVLPVAGECQKREFSYVLSKQAYHSMTEGHLWLSVFSRPPSNTFTRVQRCTCCFVLLLTAMLLNILYYDQVNEVKANAQNSLVFGPIYLSREQVSIGVIVEVLSFLPSILLVQFFRRIRSRRSQNQLSPLQQAIYQIQQQPIPVSSPKKKKGLTFPWWCLFIAYGLSIVIASVSIFFIIVRGIEFGDVKTQQWLTSLLSGFFSSILLIQPLKVVLLAIVFAFLCRKTTEDFIDDEPTGLSNDEEYLHSIRNESPFTYRSHARPNRLNRSELEWARQQRLKEIQMWSIIREFLLYILFLVVLFFATYSSLNPNASYQVRHMKQLFLNTREYQYDYTKVVTVSQYWSWLNNIFAENLRAQRWYNQELPHDLSGFIADRTNRLIGWAVMRQLRIRSQSCKIKYSVDYLFSSCQNAYSFSAEDKRSFKPNWTNETTGETSNSSIERAFLYQQADQLDSYPIIGNHHTYSGGGYVYEFRGRLDDLKTNLSILQQSNWIDQRTRAVIIQLNLYNPNSQLFTLVTLLTEFLPSGGLETFYRFEPISYLVFHSLSQMICLIVYMLFIIQLIIVEIQLLIRTKKKYFRQFWSIINLGLIGCSFGIMGVYIWRFHEANRIGNLFAETNGFTYINLQLSVYINDVFVYLLSFCCFFGTIKLTRLCRFNQRLLLFIQALPCAMKNLLSFALMFSFVYIAFTALFYLIFNSKLLSCSNLVRTSLMLFEIILMLFDVQKITSVAPFLGPFCFSLFIFIVVFVCMGMFLTIINDSFRSIRDQARSHKNDEHIFAFMFNKFQVWIGVTKANNSQLKYFDPIENFPNKIDQLFDALNHLYIDQ